MCKPKLRRIRLSASLCISTLMGLYAFLLPTPKAQGQVVNNCTAGLNASCEVNPIVTRIGGTVTIIKVKAGTTAGDCGLTNVIGFIVKPSGNTQLALTNGTLVGNGTCIGCPVAGAPECGGPGNTVTCMAINDTYVVSPNDIGDPLSITFTDPKGGIQMLNNPGIPYSVQFMPAAAGIVPPGGNRSDLLAKGAGQCASLVINPCISITKECIIDCPPNNAAVFGQAIRFRGTVCNSAAPIPPQFDIFSAPQNGNDLTNIVIADSLPAGAVAGPITFAANVTTNGVAGRAYDGSLRPGECVAYEGSYTPAGSGVALCGPFTNTISVTAVDRTGQTISNTDECFSTIGGTNYTSSGPRAPVRAICTVCTSPSIRITKGCATPLVQVGGTLMVTGVVCNTGNVPLRDVRISNAVAVPVSVSSPIITIIGDLAVNECKGWTNSYNAGTSFFGVVNDTATATGIDICSGNTVSNTASAFCTVSNPPPIIDVIKDVVCYQNGCPAENDPSWSKHATGVTSGDQFPAFCYRFKVCNVGATPVTISSASDSHIDISSCNFVGTRLAPGACTTFCVISPVEVRADRTNIFSVTATNDFNQSSSDTDTNRVRIVPFDIECVKEASLDGINFSDKVTVPFGATTPVYYRVTVSTTRTLPLVVTINDLNFNCPAITVQLTPGQPVTTNLCGGQPIQITCPPSPSNNTVHVSAVVDTSRTNICVGTRTNTTITAESECVASVVCEAPAACRVTGGGRQDEPIVCPDDDVRYVTHGGQVGAPVGQDTCSIDTSLPNWRLGNPCIHGRWTHVRHMKGGLRGNFHARFYDTLTCACLEAEHNGGLNADCSYDLLAPIGELCGDRSTGPLPRKAPANKITFTGVGDWICEPGRRQPRSCLFRVDIEDRGEPGNAHALDRNGKPNREPDRYRIRIWVLTDAEEAALRNGDGLLAFRNCISACNGIDFRDGGMKRADGVALACDENLCAGETCLPVESQPLTPAVSFGNATCTVRPPNIDDGGELLHGNHQIHPQIKDCDPANPTGPGLAKP